MTTLNEARQAVYRRFAEGWNGSTYCFDNEAFDPTGVDVWARCSVRSIAGGADTLGPPGNRKYRRRAMVRVEVYTKPGTGLKAADLLVQTALGLFEGQSLPGTRVMVFDGRTAEVGLVNDGRWHLSTAEASFDYEEVK